MTPFLYVKLKMSFRNIFKKTLPWVQSPLIANAPMSGAALSELAIAVSRAGGLGQIGFLDDRHQLSNELHVARDKLQDLMATLPDPQVLPIGVGVIVFGSPMEAWMRLFQTHKPAVVWLSFAATNELRQWTEAIRQASPKTQVWVQLGSVKAALDIAQACHPDALVLQGSDAGGHGHQDGASIVSLVPEVTDTLLQHGISDIPLIAAGGIVDGRGTAAALTLGASGVVMGTKFLSAPETRIPRVYRDAIFKASDGGQATARSRVFDEIWGPNFWPTTYDGRCLRNKVYDRYASGEDINQIRKWLSSAMNGPGADALDVHDMGSLWAGTGVGMVNMKQMAGDIVQTVRDDALKRIGSLAVED
jgi:nitronate monooxygenase